MSLTINHELLAMIQSAAAAYKLPWELVHAICETESTLHPDATRYEPNYRWLVGNPVTMSPTEREGQMTSWGLMQVMGAVAREYGFEGPFEDLKRPAVSLFYGCLHLRRFKAKYGGWPDAISAYNQGSPRRKGGTFGPYMNQQYVDKVLRAWNNLEIAIPLKESEI